MEENNKFKRVASHTVAVVIGLILASCVRSPRVEVVDREVIKEVKVEVPVEVIKEKVVEKEVVKYKYKWRTKVVKTDCPPQHVENYSVSVTRYSNRLSLLAGVGPKGLKVTTIPGGYQVEAGQGFVWGAGYALRLVGPHNVGLQFLNNGTSSLVYGYDW